MARFWVYIGDKIQGPVDIPSLRKVPGFNLLTQVCPEGEETWKMADEVIEIKSYFLSPPRPNSFAIPANGNAAPKLDFLPQPDLAPKPELEELTLPEPNTSWTSPNAEPAKKEAAPAMGGNALRAVCAVCGYKNPRDVQVCMKCGEKLSVPAASAVKAVPAVTVGPAVTAAPAVTAVPAATATPAVTAAIVEPAASSTMVEIPIAKLAGAIAAAVVVSGGIFMAVHSWKKKHAPRPTPAIAVPATTARKPARAAHTVRRATPHYDHKPLRHVEQAEAPADTAAHETESAAPAQTEPASYRVVAEATPLKKRYSSPINSPYATKRRADKTLWNSQEEQAIRQVQQTRIYGGQRTIGRNVEILMQILRDREYTTAFESGKRTYLYNDLDWGATMKDGPLYEVHLTFSGGREPDGSAKKPLHFAFNSDLERGTVEPGGQDQIRSNTLHAFFDESRIPPEDRRAIARDTEELVMAAQPGASPLALDTVVRQFAKVYTSAALARVASAYDLSLVQRRLAHDPTLGSDEPAETTSESPRHGAASSMPGMPAVERKSAAAKPAESTPAPMPTPMPLSKGGAVDFRMEQGVKRERTFIVRAATKASVGRVWEVLTGYDRLKQFVPDMLASEREGQDGAAVIVHTVCLTRYAFFVFKVNLHLRVIEHPREHTLEFERIAGEFESFRGSVDLSTDPATHDTQIGFHSTLVPSGHIPNFIMEKMANHLLVNEIEAIRAKAESNS